MTFFFDTNTLLNVDKEVLNQTSEKFYISSYTLKELEGIKTSFSKDEEVKYRARKLVQWLDKNPEKYEVICYQEKYWDEIKDFNLPDNTDSKIIATAYHFYKNKDMEYPKDKKYFATNDLLCKHLAKMIGIPVYEPEIKEEDDYTGFMEVNMNDEELNLFYTDFYPNSINHYNLLTNQYLLINNRGKIVDKYKWAGDHYEVIPYIKVESTMFGKTAPKDGDIYQQIALDTLTHNQISMLRGPAGSGKSYLAVSYLFYLLEKGKVDKIIIFCNTVATKGSAKLGFYPGSRTEKLMDSQIGNFLVSKLGDRMMVEKLIDDGTLVLLPMSDIRGYDTSGINCAVYITEAQNLDIELMRLALQRIGDDSICILDGDSNAQVDLDMYAGNKNGMRRVSQIFRGADFYGEVTLQTIKRSRIAALAQLL